MNNKTKSRILFILSLATAFCVCGISLAHDCFEGFFVGTMILFVGVIVSFILWEAKESN